MTIIDILRTRVTNRVQLTTDGHRAYLEAVKGAFGGDVDYAQLVKLYSSTISATARLPCPTAFRCANVPATRR